jgi:hypothetical protein
MEGTMQLTDWLLVEVALLLISLNKISLKNPVLATVCYRIASKAVDPVAEFVDL